MRKQKSIETLVWMSLLTLTVAALFSAPLFGAAKYDPILGKLREADTTTGTVSQADLDTASNHFQSVDDTYSTSKYSQVDANLASNSFETRITSVETGATAFLDRENDYDGNIQTNMIIKAGTNLYINGFQIKSVQTNAGVTATNAWDDNDGVTHTQVWIGGRCISYTTNGSPLQ